MSGRAIVLSGGMLEEAFIRKYLAEHTYDTLIAAEGGASFCLRNGLVPDLAVGDFDTAGSALADQLESEGISVERYPSRKDEPDTAIALSAAFSYHPSEVVIFGATGTRQDHFIANLAMLGRAAEDPETACIPVILMDAHNRISVHTAPFEVPGECAAYPYVSFFAFSEKVTGLELKGFSYPVSDFTLHRTDVIGTSNYLTEKNAFVGFDSGVLIIACAGDKE